MIIIALPHAHKFTFPRFKVMRSLNKLRKIQFPALIAGLEYLSFSVSTDVTGEVEWSEFFCLSILVLIAVLTLRVEIALFLIIFSASIFLADMIGVYMDLEVMGSKKNIVSILQLHMSTTYTLEKVSGLLIVLVFVIFRLIILAKEYSIKKSVH